ncbi:MAG TPA: Hsp20/alpha crystallin family protein [Armatimonadetes bacterium]|nr:Hsp20/alpha crystallin family protein [Armatimonadota bacterium]
MSLIRWQRRPTMLARPMMRAHDLFDELDRLFSSQASELAEEADYGPAVDVYQTDDEVVVKAQLPGVKKENIDVTIEDNMLTIRAETRREEEVDDEGYFRRELRYGTWARRLPLPAAVDEEQVSAKMADGVLEVHAKKSEKPEEAGKKIQVD